MRLNTLNVPEVMRTLISGAPVRNSREGRGNQQRFAWAAFMHPQVLWVSSPRGGSMWGKATRSGSLVDFNRKHGMTIIMTSSEPELKGMRWIVIIYRGQIAGKPAGCVGCGPDDGRGVAKGVGYVASITKLRGVADSFISISSWGCLV